MFIIEVKNLWVKGFAFWPFILVRDKTDRTVIEHEKIHIRQQLRGWLIFFYIRYLYEYFTKGYKNISYEIEAYKHQDDWKWD